MQIILDLHFLRSAKILPISTKEKLATLIELAKTNPFHPQLHAKHLSGQLSGLLSFRVSRDYRVIFCFENPQCMRLLKVAHRKDIYR